MLNIQIKGRWGILRQTNLLDMIKFQLKPQNPLKFCVSLQLFSEFSIWNGKSACELEIRWNCPGPQKRLYINKDKLSPYINPTGLIQSF